MKKRTKKNEKELVILCIKLALIIMLASFLIKITYSHFFAGAEIIKNVPEQMASFQDGYLTAKKILTIPDSKASTQAPIARVTTPRVGVSETKTSVSESDSEQTGKASWYDYSLKGYPNYSRTHLTCASRRYPRGTILNVRYGDKAITVRVNDYGPESWTGRIIDLSSYAFSQLASLSVGVIVVEVWRP